MKKITMLVISLLFCVALVGCGEEPVAEQNPLVGVWNCEQDVSHLIENTFGYENVSFSVQTEYCFRGDGTFRYSVKSVDTDALADIFYENQGNSDAALVQERIEGTQKTLQLLNDEGTYRIDENKVVLEGKGAPLTLTFVRNNDGTIELSNGNKTVILVAQ